MTNTSGKRYVIDSWAWIAYFDGARAGKRVDEITLNAETFTSAVTVAEVLSKAEREGKDTNKIFNFIVSLSKVVSVDADLASSAGLLHAHIKRDVHNFSLADAFTLQTARGVGAKVLTGDPDFKNIKDAEFLE